MVPLMMVLAAAAGDTLALVAGCTGGFTGGGRGVTVTLDSKSRVIEPERRDSAQAERLFRQAKAIGFDQTNYRRVQELFRAVHQAPGR